MRKTAEAFLASPRVDELDQDLTPGQRRLELLREPHDVGVPVYVLYPGAKAGLLPSAASGDEGWPVVASALDQARRAIFYFIPVFKVHRRVRLIEASSDAESL